MAYPEKENHDGNDSEFISRIADYLKSQDAWQVPLVVPISELDFASLAEKLGADTYQTEDSTVIRLPNTAVSMEKQSDKTIKLYLPYIVSNQHHMEYEFNLTDAYYLERENDVHFVNPVARPDGNNPHVITGVTIDWQQNVSPFWRSMGESPREVVYAAKKATECAIRISQGKGRNTERFAAFTEE